jgi:hypothetical protein
MAGRSGPDDELAWRPARLLPMQVCQGDQTAAEVHLRDRKSRYDLVGSDFA